MMKIISIDRRSVVSSEGEHSFIKHDMTRNDHAFGNRIEASVPLVFRRVSKEHTRQRARREFVWCCCGGMREAKTSEDT